MNKSSYLPEEYPSTDLSWLELQILYLLDQEPTYQKIVIEKIKSLISQKKRASVSTLYNVLSKLRSKGLLEEVIIPDAGKGNKRFLRTTTAGKHEIEKTIKWSLMVLFNLIADRVINDFQKTCRKNLSCKTNTKILYITPFTFTFTKLLDKCAECSLWDYKTMRYIYLLPNVHSDSISSTILGDNYKILPISKDDPLTIPLEDESVDSILALFTLNLLPSDTLSAFLKQIHRVLTPRGKAAFVSIKKVDSYIVEEIEEITGKTGIIPFFSDNQSALVQNYFTSEQLRSITSQWFDEVEVSILKEFQYVSGVKN